MFVSYCDNICIIKNISYCMQQDLAVTKESIIFNYLFSHVNPYSIIAFVWIINNFVNIIIIYFLQDCQSWKNIYVVVRKKRAILLSGWMRGWFNRSDKKTYPLFSTCQDPGTWLCDVIGFCLCASSTMRY